MAKKVKHRPGCTCATCEGRPWQSPTVLQIRHRLLESLQAQFQTKVSAVVLKNERSPVSQERLAKFLRDLANNMAQGFVDEDDE